MDQFEIGRFGAAFLVKQPIWQGLLIAFDTVEFALGMRFGMKLEREAGRLLRMPPLRPQVCARERALLVRHAHGPDALSEVPQVRQARVAEEGAIHGLTQ